MTDIPCNTLPFQASGIHMRRMRDGRIFGITTLVAIAMTGGAGFGQDSTSPAISLQEMAQRLADLEERNETLQGRVIELEGAEGRNWLSEERATEIRGIVTDVLADADSRTSLQNSGITAGWDDGFFLQSPDGRFRLNVGGMVQARYQYSHIRSTWDPEDGSGYQTQDDSPRRFGWEIPHARLDFSGNVFGSDTTFGLSGEFANTRSESFTTYTGSVIVATPDYGSYNGGLQLLDAWVAHELTDGFSVRVGQFKLPFDIGWEIGIANQLTGDRTATAYHFGLGRSQGIELGFDGDDIRARVAMSEGANDNLFAAYKLTTTRPENSPYFQNQSDLSFSGRVEWKLAGAWEDFDLMTSPPGEEFGLLAGFGMHWQRNKVYLNETAINQTSNGFDQFGLPVSANNYNNWIGLTADLTWNIGGASITASGYFHYIDSGASYLIQNFGLISGNQSNPGSSNPTFDVGVVTMAGASLYGAMYLTPEIEAFAGFDWMDVLSDGFDQGLSAVGSGNLASYNAYSDPEPYFGITAGGTWYVDGEDLKVGVSITFSPQEVSPNWTTPQIGIRTTPGSDMYVLRTYVQLLF